MRIAHVINALRVGGAEKLVITFAGEMRRRGIDFTIITLRQNDPEMLKQAAAEGARIAQFSHRKLFAPGRFKKLVDFLRAEKFDILHTHLTMANILGASAGYMVGIPVVTSLHNTTMHSQSQFLHTRLETWLLRNSVKRVLAVGWETANAHAERLKDKPILVLPNAVHTPPSLSSEERCAVRQELVNDPHAPLLIYVGRLVPQKGVRDLVTAFAVVNRSHPQARLIVAGVGPLEEELQTQIHTLGLKERARLLGPRRDVPRLLAASDLFVSAAHWEGLPVASLEAMAAGLPVVATAVGDLPRVVTPETGILTPPRAPERLAAAISALLESPEARTAAGAAAQIRIQLEFSARAWADRLLKMYSEVIREAKIDRHS